MNAGVEKRTPGIGAFDTFRSYSCLCPGHIGGCVRRLHAQYDFLWSKFSDILDSHNLGVLKPQPVIFCPRHFFKRALVSIQS